jgi:hypothetical protein
VQQLTFIHDITPEELSSFLQLLNTDPQELAATGGMEHRMREIGLQTIWANEINLSTIFQKRRQREASALAGDADVSPAKNDFSPPRAVPLNDEESALSLDALLEKLTTEKDDQKFSNLSKILIKRIEDLRKRDDLSFVLPTTITLMGIIEDALRGNKQQQTALTTLKLVVTGDIADHIVQMLEKRGAAWEKAVFRLCGYVGDLLATPLIQRLCTAENLATRKVLAYALVRSGKAALPFLTAMLNDDRWYVVRNVLSIIGEIAVPSSLAEMRKLIGHHEIKVRKELIRAVSKISSPDADAILIDLLSDRQQDISSLAARSLGLRGCRAAMPKLLALVSAPDPLLRRLTLKKEAVTALGRIGNIQAVNTLLSVLNNSNWLARQRWLDLKRSAAAALGQLADKSALPDLARLAKGSSSLAAACNDAKQSIERLSK